MAFQEAFADELLKLAEGPKTGWPHSAAKQQGAWQQRRPFKETIVGHKVLQRAKAMKPAAPKAARGGPWSQSLTAKHRGITSTPLQPSKRKVVSTPLPVSSPLQVAQQPVKRGVKP